MLNNLSEDDPEGRERIAAFLQSLQQLGWSDGRNVKIDYRWGANDADRVKRYAAELVALAPDVILTAGTLSVAVLQQATRTVPIVFGRSSTQSAPDLSRPLRDRAPTSPASLFSSTASVLNGWSCSSKLHRT